MRLWLESFQPYDGDEVAQPVRGGSAARVE